MELFKLFGTLAITGADQAEHDINDVTNTAEKSESKISGAFKKIGAAVAAAFAVEKIKQFGVAIVQASAEVAAEEAAFTQIMGDYSDEAAAKVAKIAEATGMVDSRLTPYMTSMTAKFKGLGFDIDGATDLASTGLTIAADAAAFWDKSLTDSMGALNSFVNGNYEGGEAIGLFANETTLAKWAADNLGYTWADLSEKEKQFTRLQFAKAMQEASGAAGQAAKESGAYQNVMGNLTEAWRQFKAQIGEPLLQNIVIPAMKMLGDFITNTLSPGFENLKQTILENKDTLKTLATVIAVVVGALASLKAGELAYQASLKITIALEKAGAIFKNLYALATGKLTMAELKQTAAQLGLNTAMLSSPITWIVAGIVALVAILAVAYKKNEEFRNTIQELWGQLQELFKTLWNDLKPAFDQIIAAFKDAWAIIQEKLLPILMDLINQILPVIVQLLADLLPIIVQIISKILPVIVDLLLQLVPVIVEIIEMILPVVIELLDILLPILLKIIESVLPIIVEILDVLVPILKAVIEALGPILDLVVTLLKPLIDLIKPSLSLLSVWGEVVKFIMDFFQPALEWITETLGKVITFISNVFTTKWSSQWNTISSVFANVWNGIKNFAANIWNGIKNLASNVFNGIKNTISNIFNGIKTTATNTWNGIKNAITTPIENAKNKVKDVIDKIKGFFNFKWSLPKLKVPKFSISPSGWKVGDLLKGVKPKLGVTWAAKGGIFDEPTLFNTPTGMLGVGEAGAEAVAPIDKLTGYVKTAVQSETNGLSDRLDRLIDLLVRFFPELLNGMDKSVVLDSGALVGQLAPKMNKKFNDMAKANSRGG